MKSLSKWAVATAALAFLAGTSAAADAVLAGTVKAINADKKEVVMTPDGGKDTTFKLGDNLTINRGGKESASDLKVGDPVNILYDKGLTGLTWTAKYILVKEGDYKFSELEHGAFKSYDPDKKELSFTDDYKHDLTFPVSDAKVRINQGDAKPEALKIGDTVLAIVEKVGDKVNLKAIMVDRK